jgi:hypothetical protein
MNPLRTLHDRLYRADPKGREVVVSYLTLRKIVGLLGMVLPFAVVFERWLRYPGTPMLGSISDYYVRPSGDLFVGILFTVAFFLIAYRGYDPEDNKAGDLAGLCAIGVALCPVTAGDRTAVMHLIFASVLFATLGYFSNNLFTRSDKPPSAWAKPKQRRNQIYHACGWTIWGCLGVLALYNLWLWYTHQETGLVLLGVPVVWFFEMVMLEAFGYSWMVKGEAWWGD